jgi:hypothetical protein
MGAVAALPGRRRKPVNWHLLNPTQRADLPRLFAVVPNARRLAVLAAYIGLPLRDLYDELGLSHRVRNYYLPGQPGAGAWNEQAIAWCWRISQQLDVRMTDLWDIDEAFVPADAVPVGPIPFERQRGGQRERRKGVREHEAFVAERSLHIVATR